MVPKRALVESESTRLFSRFALGWAGPPGEEEAPEEAPEAEEEEEEEEVEEAEARGDGLRGARRALLICGTHGLRPFVVHLMHDDDEGAQSHRDLALRQASQRRKGADMFLGGGAGWGGMG